MKSTLRVSSALLSVGLVASLAAATPGTAAAATAPAPAAAKVVRTNFALAALGYGSAVRGGSVPSASDEATAYQVLACTARAGLVRTNYVTSTALPGLGNVRGIRTRVWTAKTGRVVSSYSSQRIAEVVIAESALGRLSLQGVSSLSRAYHDGTRFRTQSESSVAKVVFRPASGQPRVLEVPTPGDPLVVPGLARIRVGGGETRSLGNGVSVQTDALDVRVLPTSTRTTIAHSAASIRSGVTYGLFRGFSAGVRGRGLADNVRIGRTPLAVLPCTGTGGKETGRSAARLSVPGVISASGLRTQQLARQTRRRASAFEQGTVGRVVLGDGQVVITGVVGRANVRRVGTRMLRNGKGTGVGTVVVNGETREFPRSGVIEIPGVLRIEESVVTPIKSGLSAVGARITLLDGTGGVIDLGVAQVRIVRK